MKKDKKLFIIMFICMVVLPMIPICYSMYTGNQLFLLNIISFALTKPHYLLLIIIVLSLLITWLMVVWAFYRSAGWLGLQYNILPLPFGIREAYRIRQAMRETKILKFLQKWVPPKDKLMH